MKTVVGIKGVVRNGKMEELKNLLTANVNKVTELLHKKEKEEIMEEKKNQKLV